MKTPEARKREAKVWHVVDYEYLFKAMAPNRSGDGELDQVQYTQRHIDANQQRPQAQRHLLLMRALRQTAESTELYIVTKWVYEELLDQSQAHCGQHKYLRGYVVDERLRPPTLKRISQMLGLDEKTVKRALDKLAYHGLLEQVAMPQAGSGTDGGGSENAADDGKKAEKKARKRKVHSKCTSSAPEVHLPLKNGKGKEKKNTRPSASDKTKRENLGLSASEEAQGPAAGAAGNQTGTGQTPAQAGSEGQCEGEGPNTEGDSESEPQAGQRPAAATGTDKPNAPRSPATTPPMAESEEPTETDGGGGDVSQEQALSMAFGRSGGGAADPPTDRLSTAYDADLFASEAYRRLKMSGYAAPDEPKGKAELASFRSVWQVVRTQVVQLSSLEKLRDKAMRQADELGRRFERTPKKFDKGHPGAVFNKKIKGLIAKYKPG